MPLAPYAWPLDTAPAWVQSGAGWDFDYTTDRYFFAGGTAIDVTTGHAMAGITNTRSSAATNLLPGSASGFVYTSFASGIICRDASGMILGEARVNLFLNSTAPVTQNINLASTGTYVLWCNGSGSAAIAQNTATITGAGTATNGTPVTINCTVIGTVDVTITGSLNAVQLEKGAGGTSFIVTAGASATRNADVLVFPKANWYNATAGTWYAQYGPSAPFINAPRIVGAANGSITPLFANSTTVVGTFNGAASLTAAAGTNITTASVKSAHGYDSTGRSVVHNGGTVATAATFEVTPTANFNIGSDNGSAQMLNGPIARLTYWPVRLPDAALKLLTT